jgi:NADH-quinone oxidoreductase subunit K|tara:strand:- start:257 stop:568 length:312 start_codon:yes stop_codon:yes gene_type:complete
MMIEVTTDWYLTLASLLFSIGFIGMMIRKNALIMFMCIELMLNAVNLTFITASKHFGTIDAQVAVFFVLVVAAAEVVVGLAIIVSIFKKQETASVDILRSSKG